ncbi:uncharacterized protein V6R79_006560 [Siganus canaliculatus]
MQSDIDVFLLMMGCDRPVKDKRFNAQRESPCSATLCPADGALDIHQRTKSSEPPVQHAREAEHQCGNLSVHTGGAFQGWLEPLLTTLNESQSVIGVVQSLNPNVGDGKCAHIFLPGWYRFRSGSGLHSCTLVPVQRQTVVVPIFRKRDQRNM